MNEERLYRIIIGPHMTEKSARIADKDRQIVFKVANDATKPEIKQAIEKLFSVSVEDVRTLRVRGKKRVFKRIAGCRSGWKKAMICLAPGHDINLANFE